MMADVGALIVLPPELLDHVLDEVEAGPCYRRTYGCCDCTPSINGLASLCLLSRKWNELATPRLYRNIICYRTKRCLLLVRTLIGRRDLAVLVKDLDLQKMKTPDEEDLPP